MFYPTTQMLLCTIFFYTCRNDKIDNKEYQYTPPSELFCLAFLLAKMTHFFRFLKDRRIVVRGQFDILNTQTDDRSLSRLGSGTLRKKWQLVQFYGRHNFSLFDRFFFHILTIYTMLSCNSILICIYCFIQKFISALRSKRQDKLFDNQIMCHSGMTCLPNDSLLRFQCILSCCLEMH